MFISEVVAVNADEKYIDEKTGLFRLNDSVPVCYSHGKYYETGKSDRQIWFFSRRRKKNRNICINLLIS